MSNNDIHMIKKSYDGYCIGKCAEYPAVSVFAKTDDKLKQNLEEGVDFYLKYMNKEGKELEESKVIKIGRRMD